MKIVFLDAATVIDEVTAPIFSKLENLTLYDSTKPEEVFERIKDVDVIITNKVYIGKEQIDSDPNLKLICVAATGMNNVDLKYAGQKGIPVRNAVNYSTDSVAQVTFMQILNLVGKSAAFDDYCKSGKYSASGCFTTISIPFYNLKGKRLGIVGLGNIGSKVAEIAASFGMEVAYYATSGIAHSDKYPALSLDELLSESDIVSVHAPLNERTDNLIDYSQISKMKPSAFLLNMGRGGIVNESDLAVALDEGLIAGAAVDVYTKEPIPAGHPYLSMAHPERLLMTPHIAWASNQARVSLAEKIVDNINQTLK